jgi:anti-sigma-K factor RskA
MDIVGELVVDREYNRAVIQVANLPPIREDQAFQLWLRDSEGTILDGGLFVRNHYGPTYVTLPLQAPFDTYAGVGVSLEPATGSPLGNRRSGPSVFRVSLSDT